jgi:hypothetical protein
MELVRLYLDSKFHHFKTGSPSVTRRQHFSKKSTMMHALANKSTAVHNSYRKTQQSSISPEGLTMSRPQENTQEGSSEAPAPPDKSPVGLTMSRPEEKSQEGSSEAPAPPDKVKVHFVPVGSAPIMIKTKFQIGGDKRWLSVHMFLRKMLKLQGDSLFLYCGNFCPGPEELVGDLSDCFAKRGELIIHYSLQEAWG